MTKLTPEQNFELENLLNGIRNQHNKTLNDALESAKRSYINKIEWLTSQARKKEKK